MKISLNTIRKLNDQYGCAGDIAPQGSDELAVRIGAQLGAIEEVIDIGSRYQGVVIVRVVACDKHPNADKLNVCRIDDGGQVQGVERDADGLVQVVCGAPNVRAGLTVAWLPPGSTVPESVGKDPFVLGARELRGVVSNGMLASARELALGDSHDGILEIDGDIAPGTDFAVHFGLAGDVVFDIENKMFTHRPDCFGFLGVSRELAGIRQLPFKSPEWYRTDAPLPAVEAEPLPLAVRNEIPELVPRFCAIALRDVQVGPSPVWLQVELAKLGQRPINNIVDYTNYFMLLTGQPIHAYDYDKVRSFAGGDAAELTIRFPKPGEKITLLNGKEIEPGEKVMMVAAGDHLACVGGAMGGADTEVDGASTNIIIEAANWDMYAIRRTAMAHGIFTDAVTRFNKGQSPLQNQAVVAAIVGEIRRTAGGKVASAFIDDNHLSQDVRERGAVHAPVTLTTEFINIRLGLELSAAEIAGLLTNVEFDVQATGGERKIQTNASFDVSLTDALTVTAPFWRTDIEIPEDVVEEVGRLYGFDRLPLVLPVRAIEPGRRHAGFDLKQRIRDVLATAGANEVLSYSFVHGRLLERAGQDLSQAFSLSNALSPDLQYYRLSLTPSLLDKVHANIKAGYDEFVLFEIGKAHVKGHDDDHGLPVEYGRVACVYAATDKAASTDGAPFYQAKTYLDALLTALGLPDVTYEPVDDGSQESATPYYQPGRAATVRLGGTVIGRVGEYAAATRKALKLPARAAGFELGLSALAELAGPAQRYTPLSRFPRIEQDICLKVAADVAYGRLFELVAKQITASAPERARYSVTPVDIYQRPDDPGHKQVTFRLSIASYDKTLRDSEVAQLLDNVATTAASQLAAERI